MKTYQSPFGQIFEISAADVLTASPAEFQDVNISDLLAQI